MIKKNAQELFWMVQGSKAERCGPVAVDNDASYHISEKLKANEKRTLLEALSTPTTSLIEGKIVQVSNNVQKYSSAPLNNGQPK